jgi:hypothetical protein
MRPDLAAPCTEPTIMPANPRKRPRGSRPEGWIMLRFTWHDLDTRPGYVLSEIRAALAAAA